jgi:hypothetical protein
MQQQKYSKLAIGLICIFGQMMYSTYYFKNEEENPFLYGAIGVLCDKSHYALYKLTQFWAMTTRVVFIVFLMEQFITEKNHAVFKNFTPKFAFKSFVSKFILFVIFSFLFHIIFSFILTLEIHYFVSDLQWNNLTFTLKQFHTSHLMEFLLYAICLFLIAFFTRKYLILMTVLIFLFSFNVKIPFLIGHSNMEILKNECLPKP